MSDIANTYTVRGLYLDLASEMEGTNVNYNCAAITVSWLQHEFGVKVRMPYRWAAILMLHDYRPADPIDWSRVEYVDE